MGPVGSRVRTAIQQDVRPLTGVWTLERVALCSLLVYLAVLLAASALLACLPAGAGLRRFLTPAPCSMLSHFGVPCPLCKGTTTFVMIWWGQLGEALRLNPFAFAMFWGMVAAVPALAYLVVTGRSIRSFFGRMPKHAGLWVGIVLGGLFLLNWVYLIARFSVD